MKMNHITYRILTLVIAVLFMTSCSSSDNIPRRTSKSTKSASTTKEDADRNKGKVKERKWTEGKDEARPPITNDMSSSSDDNLASGSSASASIDKEESYDITYFIPFDAGTYVNSARKSDRFIHYYAGMQVATRILEKEGINLNINVVDEKKRSFSTIMRSSIPQGTDVIVGPYDRNALKEAASFAKEERIPLVSPWQASPKIANDNPYYIQLRPNLDEHYYSIMEDIQDNYDLEQVFVLGRIADSKDNKRVKKLQKMAKDVWTGEEDHLQEMFLIPDSIAMGETAYDSVFFEDKETVFILPNWSGKDIDFIYGALRKMNVEKGLNKVVVYGMPILLNNSKIEFDFYGSLNLRVARSKFVDDGDGDVKRFKRDYVDQFGALPTDDAYEGYDNLMYIGRNLYQYGKNFQFHLSKDDGYYLQAKYNVTPTREDSDSDKGGDIKYFENKNVDIIEFKNSRFTRSAD